MTTRWCEECSADISHMRSSSRFCSKKCYDSPRFNGTYCSWCRSPLIVRLSHVKRTKSCSRRCLFLEQNPNFKEDFFSEPNLKNSYWAGFIAADGCIEIRKSGQRVLSLGLKTTDQGQLVRLRSSIGAGHIDHVSQMDKRTQKIYYRSVYRISSNSLCQDLKDNFNIVPRKSLVYQPPPLKGELALAFIAGYIDGDGSYTSSGLTRPRISILGTHDLLSWIQEECGLTNKISKDRNVFSIFISGNDAIKIRESIHALNLPLLERKRNRWEELNLNLEILNKGE